MKNVIHGCNTIIFKTGGIKLRAKPEFRLGAAIQVSFHRLLVTCTNAASGSRTLLRRDITPTGQFPTQLFHQPDSSLTK